MNEVQTFIDIHKKRIWSVDFNPIKNILVTSGAEQFLAVYKYAGDKYTHIYNQDLSSQHQARTIRRVKFSPCGNYLAVASFDSTVSLWSDSEYLKLPNLNSSKFCKMK